MNNETFIHSGVSPINLLKEVHYRQAEGGKHSCSTCAYEQGFKLASSKQWLQFKG